jgi:hypothetical protein
MSKKPLYKGYCLVYHKYITGEMAMNENSNVYRTHQNCETTLRFNENTKHYRFWCLEHKKWLDTPKPELVEQYFKLVDEGHL